MARKWKCIRSAPYFTKGKIYSESRNNKIMELIGDNSKAIPLPDSYMDYFKLEEKKK